MEKEEKSLDIRGSHWFQRFMREAKKLSPHLRFKRIKYGFWRVYYKQAYVTEVYEEMPIIGHDIEEVDQRFENQKYYEEFEDNAQLTRKIKNYIEGYYDSIQTLRRRIYMIRNNKEFFEVASKAYRMMRVV